MLTLILSIWAIGFILNLVWKFRHCMLYDTCHTMPKNKLKKLLILMSAKDGFFIVLFYLITFLVFNNQNITINLIPFSVFILLCLGFSFIDEKISLKLKRWKYTNRMPKLFGIGLSPLLEIAEIGRAHV